MSANSVRIATTSALHEDTGSADSIHTWIGWVGCGGLRVWLHRSLKGLGTSQNVQLEVCDICGSRFQTFDVNLEGSH